MSHNYKTSKDFMEDMKNSKYKLVSTGCGFNYFFDNIEGDSIMVIDSDGEEHEFRIKDIAHVSE